MKSMHRSTMGDDETRPDAEEVTRLAGLDMDWQEQQWRDGAAERHSARAAQGPAKVQTHLPYGHVDGGFDWELLLPARIRALRGPVEDVPVWGPLHQSREFAYTSDVGLAYVDVEMHAQVGPGSLYVSRYILDYTIAMWFAACADLLLLIPWILCTPVLAAVWWNRRGPDGLLETLQSYGLWTAGRTLLWRRLARRLERDPYFGIYPFNCPARCLRAFVEQLRLQEELKVAKATPIKLLVPAPVSAQERPVAAQRAAREDLEARRSKPLSPEERVAREEVVSEGTKVLTQAIRALNCVYMRSAQKTITSPQFIAWSILCLVGGLALILTGPLIDMQEEAYPEWESTLLLVCLGMLLAAAPLPAYFVWARLFAGRNTKIYTDVHSACALLSTHPFLSKHKISLCLLEQVEKPIPDDVPHFAASRKHPAFSGWQRTQWLRIINQAQFGQ